MTPRSASPLPILALPRVLWLAGVLTTLLCWNVGGLLEIPIEVFDSELAWRVNG